MKSFKSFAFLPLVILIHTSAVVHAQSPRVKLEAFTEPYRQIAVSAPEMGVLSEITVSEGDPVREGQWLAQLDDTILRASLEVARSNMQSVGRVREAAANLAAQQRQLDSYQALQEKGNATQREIDRAREAVQASQARVQIVNEDLEIKKLEFERTKAQLAQRKITAPLDGVVTTIDKWSGEFVSPTDPVVLHIAQLNRLLAVFSVPLGDADGFVKNDQVRLTISDSGRTVTGVIEFVSPVADAQSASRVIKIRIDNFDGSLPAGATCRWDLNHSTPARNERDRLSFAPPSTQR